MMGAPLLCSLISAYYMGEWSYIEYCSQVRGGVPTQCDNTAIAGASQCDVTHPTTLHGLVNISSITPKHPCCLLPPGTPFGGPGACHCLPAWQECQWRGCAG